MSLCPKCGLITCDHTPYERIQTIEEVERPLTKEELDLWRMLPPGYPLVIELAKKNRHLQTVA